MGSSRIKEFRHVLHLDDKPMDIIPDAYFALVVPGTLNKEYREFLDKRGLSLGASHPARLLEWLGDSILELATRSMLLQYGRDHPMHFLNDVRMNIVKNANLYCLLVQKRICNTSENIDDRKRCANILETVLGIIYYALYREAEIMNAESLAESWLEDTFDLFNEIRRRVSGEPGSQSCFAR